MSTEHINGKLVTSSM